MHQVKCPIAPYYCCHTVGILKKTIILENNVSDPDPYHLAGSGSISDDTDPIPGRAKNLKPKP